MTGPLAGLRIVEMAGMGPVPFCATMLADLGADIIRIDRPDHTMDTAQAAARIVGRGTRSVTLDLRSAAGKEAALRLIGSADALLEGFRPGVMERLGLGPQECLAQNGGLVYGRMTGWGQDGPLSSAAGHDLNYIAISGALASIGKRGEAPTPPLNLVGDYGGGAMMLALGVVSALLAVRAGNAGGQVIDMAMSDGAAMLMLPIYGMLAGKRWEPERGANALDGAAPYYRCYRCADGEWVAIASIEPRFHTLLLRTLGIDPAEYGAQTDRKAWPHQIALLERIFSTRPRHAWCELMEGSDICFAPVLRMPEVAAHSHNVARGTFIELGGVLQPAPPIRFSATPCEVRRAPPAAGADTREILQEAGFTATEIAGLTA